MHAGFAVYFPELFPTRLRGTGGGFCFNGGRLLAAPILVLNALMRSWGVSLCNSGAILGLLFLVGALVLIVAPETRGGNCRPDPRKTDREWRISVQTVRAVL